jgi:hypothetical protein
MNTPITLKDLLIGLAIGIIFSFVSNVFSPKPRFTKSETFNDEVFELKRENAKLEGENKTYKRWLDSLSPMLTQEQRNSLLSKM